ncbi:Uncharacterised protein [Zhongshania aliphaticivorans]|uniref:Uncharacterized protein n=1 Tax=Zhongshania aliphaticivorans TaxID=1470434 RepID=A0A5S9PZJ5_9GAMM|nr:hypothetical protein [Zhongshania aliphaticivorans]CAA0110148.1 Uncharacterised protein [Zhongshania aliphaticivorans]CAA0118014.1 Uncharacterised protein [Zhongshania aliphaticivorans]CAA0121915.1 Uncharacterised protein [Zhongshania aliphaticivorans]
MTETREIDAYTKHVMANIDSDIFSTLNLTQIRAIETAIGRNAPFRQHAIDLRGSIRLFFARFYFVILFGRDHRHTVQTTENNRRKEAKSISFVILLFVLGCLLIPAILFSIYVLKSFLGIDLFPEQHLSDFIHF